MDEWFNRQSAKLYTPIRVWLRPQWDRDAQ